MEALALVSLVGNIFGFIDFGIKILSKSAELHSSHEGALTEHTNIETVTNHLVSLQNTLKVDATASTSDPELTKLCDLCHAASIELLAALSKVKVEGKPNRWVSVRKALRSVWSKAKIENLAQRLLRLRDELNLHVVAHLRNQIAQSKLENDDSLKSFDEKTQVSIDKAISKIEDEHTKTRNELTLEIRGTQDKRQEHQANAPYWCVPITRTQMFVGRATELDAVEGKLFKVGYSSRVAITGLGGIGKTRTALEIAYRVKDRHPNCSVFWIVATSLPTLQQSFSYIGQQMHISALEQQEANLPKLVRDHLSRNCAGKWLLVIDNADCHDTWYKKVNHSTESHLVKYLPRSENGSILFTTRNRKAATNLAGGNVFPLAEVNEDTAKAILGNYLINKDALKNHNATSQLLDRLTYLPLAIVQAAAYINKNDIPLSEYLSLLDSTEGDAIEILREDFEDGDRYGDLMNPIATTWLISFEGIQRHDPLAADYLCFMSCLVPKAVPQFLLPPAPSKKHSIDAIGTLSAYSFVTKRPADQSLDLHRLVYLATRSWLRNSGTLCDWTAKVAARLVEVFPGAEWANKTVWRALLPHVQKVGASGLLQKDTPDNQRLALVSADCLRMDGRYREAERQLMAFGKTGDRSDFAVRRHNLDIRDIRDTLTNMYSRQNRLNEAEELNAQNLKKSKIASGKKELQAKSYAHSWP